MRFNRRGVLLLGGAALVGVAAPPHIIRQSAAAEWVPPSAAQVHRWEQERWGAHPRFSPQLLRNKRKTEKAVRGDIDRHTVTAKRILEAQGKHDRAALLARDREQFQDEVHRLWQDAELLYEHGPLPPYIYHVADIQQGEFYDAQLYAGGRELRNVVAHRTGGAHHVSDRQFVLSGEAMRQTIPGVCCNCSLTVVDDPSMPKCVPLPKEPNVLTVEQGLGLA